MDPVVYDVADFAKAFGLSVYTVYRLMDQKVIPEMPRWGRRRTIPRAFVDRVIAEAMADADPAEFARRLRVAS